MGPISRVLSYFLINDVCLCLCSHLEYVPKLKVDGTPMKRSPNVYARFVKEHYSTVKASSPWRAHGEIMAKIRQLYYESKKDQS